MRTKEERRNRYVAEQTATLTAKIKTLTQTIKNLRSELEAKTIENNRLLNEIDRLKQKQKSEAVEVN